MARLSPDEGFELLKDRVTKTVDGLFPIVGKKHTLELKNVEVKDDLNLEDIRSQKKAKLSNRTWAVPVEATVLLKDNTTGKALDQKKLRLMELPKHTRRYSHIVDGQEYQIDNQWRLKSGAYSRVKDNGELSTFFNLQKGRGFDVGFDPKSRQFTMNYGTSNIPLQPLLQELGISDDQLSKKWGSQIVQANQKDTEKALAKFYKASTGEKAPSLEVAREHLKETLSGTELRPDTTKITLGKPYRQVTGDALADAATKLLKISKGEASPDARDALMFKELHSTEDFFAERIAKGTRDIMRRIANNIDRKNKVSDVVGPDVFNRPIKEMYRTSLANIPDQINPLEMISGQMKTTITGEGGIKSAHGISEEAKLVDPSHLGYLDPIHTPEGKSTGVSLRLPIGVKKVGNDVTIPMYNIKTGRTEHVNPEKAMGATVVLPDQVRWEKGKPVSAAKVIKMSGPGNEIVEGSLKQADYIMRDPIQMFSMASNMVPFIAADHPNRSTMAGRHMEQAISLRDREAPLVQSLAGTRSFDQVMGSYAGHPSTVGGVVKKVKKDAILVAGDDGKDHEVQIYDHFPLNADKSFLHSEPLVKPGDRVQKGQPLADTNFTRGGSLALGTNLKVGYMPYKGYNFEDGVVISESAAEKLSSEHLHRKTISRDQSHIFSKKKYQSYVPDGMTRVQADKLDDEGVAKPGQLIMPGDPLIAALRKSVERKEDMELARIHKSLVRPYKDASVRWEGDRPGFVTEVVKKGKNTAVHVKTIEPMEVGDKLAGRHGNKGIVTRIIPDDEMPQAGGAPLQVLLNPTGVPGRTNLGQVLETAAGKIAEKTGKPYTIKNFQPNADLHKQVSEDLKKHGLKDKEDIIDPISGRVMGQALVGPQHIIKLQHQVDKKLRARAGGPGYAYDQNMVPKGGGPHGAQALGTLGLYSMLAHGAKCFLAGTTIRTASGRRMEISDIVRNRREIEVESWNAAENRIEQKPVVAWSCRVANPDELLQLAVVARNPSGQQHLYKIKVTSGHEFYTSSGKVEAGDLETGDKLLTPGLRLHPMQRQMILGSVLGDGSLSRSETFSSGYRVTHGAPQEDYCRWKHKICAGLVRADVQKVTKSRGSYSKGPKYRFWTLSVGELSELRRIFYPDGKKIIPQSVLDELTEVGLAFWFMDDGNTDVQKDRPQKYRTVRMALCDFSKGDCERAKAWFMQRWGLECSIQWKEDKYPYLHFFNEQATKFLRIVSPYIHPVMRYKLRLDIENHGFSEEEERRVGALHHMVEMKAEEGLEEVTILSADHYSPKHYEDYLAYNIEVEDNHNYFADSVLVGNSNLREMQTLKSDAAQNDHFWSALQAGESLPAPRPTFAYKKFTSYLNTLGVNVKKEGNNLQLIPFTDKQVLDMSNGQVEDGGRMVRAKDLKPEKGGLFDQKVTGGMEGTKWSHIKLPEPFPNPLFEKPIQSLTGMTGKEFGDVVSGKKAYDPKTGKLTEDLDSGIIGGKAIAEMLGKIDVKKELVKAEKELSNPNLKDNRLDRANRKVKYLRALNDAGLTATDAYLTTVVPVLPPSMRPVSQLPNGDLNVDDLNHMYKGISLSAQQLKGSSPLLPEEEKSELRGDVYDGLKSLAGLGGHNNREFRGVLDIIGGRRPDRITGHKSGQPKQGFFQGKLVQRKQDLSMRSTIIPEPALGLDEVGIPKPAALEIYKPFVVREIRNLTGVSPLQAQKQIKEGGELVEKALIRVMDQRPLLLKRDPALHKYSVQAFKPRLVGGKAVQIHPLVTSGFNADFDGDTMAAFVPVGQKAVEEARGMFPSRNLFSPATGSLMYTPTLETQLGLYGLTKPGQKTDKTFNTIAEVESAHRRGELGLNDQIRVGGISSTAGKFMLAGALPGDMRKDFLSKKEPLGAKDQKELLTRLAKEHRNDYGVAINSLKDLGNLWSTETAFSIGLDDIAPEKKIRDSILRKADRAVGLVRAKETDPKKIDQKVIQIYDKATQEMQRGIGSMPESQSNLLIMNRSGIKPGNDALRQIKMAPMLIANAKGEVIPTPVRKSYAEGLDLSGYWTSMSGARKGIIQKVQSVQEPGYITKQVMNSVMNNLIINDDCGTDKGIALNTDDKDVLDRYLLAPVKAGKKTIPSGTLVTPEIRNTLRNNKVGRVVVRSPLRCEHGPGFCQKCYGLTEDGMEPEVGRNVGVLAGHALGERAVQLSMKAFHCNHADSIVFVRDGDRHVIAPTMEDLFEMVEGEVVLEGDEEVKAAEGWEIWDGKWVELTHVRRHRPSRPMILVSDGHLVTICQDNHPIGVWQNNVVCEECGYHRFKDPHKKQRQYCAKCGHAQDAPDQKVGGAGFLPPSELEKGRYYLHHDLSPAVCGEVDDPELDPYLVGMFLAEGCVVWKKSHKRQREKRPYQIQISQQPGEIRDELMRRAGIHRPKGKPRYVAIDNVELGHQFHELFGRYSRHKSLPHDFLGYSSGWLNSVIAGIIDGDGTVLRHKDGPPMISIDTTSFAMAQQIALICAVNDMRAGIVATTERELTRHQGYQVRIAMSQNAISQLYASIKVRKLAEEDRRSPNWERELSGFSLIGAVREVLYTHDYVYDATTETGTLYVSGLKHHNTGGTAASKTEIVDEFQRVKDLLKFPKKLKGSATLSTVSGKVTGIEKDPAGGHNVFINDQRHYVPENRGVPQYGGKILRGGMEIKKGGAISAGPVNPHEMLPLTGIEPVQGYLADELHKVYGPHGIRRRNTEVAVKALTNLTKIEDPGDHKEFIRGDFAPTTRVANINRSTRDMKPIVHQPVLKGVNVLPLDMQEDWIARLNHERLMQTVPEAASKGWSSSIRGQHPIPPVVYGAIFGEEEGVY